MTDHPINDVFVDGVAVAKADARDYERTYNRIRVPSFAWVRARDLTDCFGFDYIGEPFDLDAGDTTTADDGATCIVDAAGNRFKSVLNVPSGLSTLFLEIVRDINATDDTGLSS